MLGARVVDARSGRPRRATSRGGELALRRARRRDRRPAAPAPARSCRAACTTLRTLADARALRAELVPDARLVVVGGGFVGAEVASTARALGVEVTIVEAAPAPLARVLGDEVGLLLAERWRAHGVDVRLGTGVAHIRSDATGRVDSRRARRRHELRGRRRRSSASAPSRRASCCRGARPCTSACGDVVGPGHWTAAAPTALAAARRILGLPPPPQPHYVWSDQFGLRLQVVGTPAAGRRVRARRHGDSFAVRYLDAGGGVRAGLLANRPAEAAALRRRSPETR